MKSKEFTGKLLEYNRDITAKNFGTRLLDAGKRDRSLVSDKFKEHLSIETILLNLENADPTPNKQYVPTLAKWYSAGGLKIEDLLSRGKDALENFEIFKRRNLLPVESKDIGRYTSFSDFECSMKAFEMRLAFDEFEKEDGKLHKGKSKIFYEDADVRIIIPLDEAAAKYYGQGTRWCTAAKNNNAFVHYHNDNSPLYIILPKHQSHPGEKWQFHFKSRQFCDETDQNINLWEFFGRYPQLRSVFKNIAPSLLPAEFKNIGRRNKSFLPLSFSLDISQETLSRVVARFREQVKKADFHDLIRNEIYEACIEYQSGVANRLIKGLSKKINFINVTIKYNITEDPNIPLMLETQSEDLESDYGLQMAELLDVSSLPEISNLDEFPDWQLQEIESTLSYFITSKIFDELQSLFVDELERAAGVQSSTPTLINTK
jgi:hypothetical protein